MTTSFGGGLLLWLDETDVTPYTGLSFWVRGTTPAGTMGVSVDLPLPDTCAETTCTGPSVEFELSSEWTRHSFDWIDFQSGLGPSAEEITLPQPEVTGLNFSAHMVYEQDTSGNWTPVPGAFDVEIDDIVLY